MRLSLATGFTLLVTGTAAIAADRSQIRATNGVLLDVYSDTFAERYEYTAPSIDFTEDDARTPSRSFALVAAIKKGGTAGKPVVVGNIYYVGEWHRYESALFKGGDPAPFKNTSREVLSCRYGCSYTEGFELDITPEQVAKYAQNGILQVQLRAASSNTALISIPVSYFDAVTEASR